MQSNELYLPLPMIRCFEHVYEIYSELEGCFKVIFSRNSYVSLILTLNY
jgi:hypothetical protein